MAKNDVVLIDGIIDERLSKGIPSPNKDEVFEYLVFEQLLKDYDLGRDEIEAGWIDGRNDGGIDGFFIFINGHLLEDYDAFAWPRSHAAIEVWLFTCKHHATFQQGPLDLVLATIQELFDLSVDEGDLKGAYSQELLSFRALLIRTYRRLSIGRPQLAFRIVYGSRGDTTQIGDSVSVRARQIESLITGLFSSCTATFQFIGAAELVDAHRKAKKFSLSLPFLEHLATANGSYVCLVRLQDYWEFVSDESGNLRRYLFDSNVRDYLGDQSVNQDIAQSLLDESGPEFWWLNNGVTILATHATVPGKAIQLQDIQIVNGLQTTETIYRHFQQGHVTSKDRALLVKILITTDTVARDSIIRATNNQSPVEIAALHATDKIQRDIEQILERNEWFYERRRNYYRNIGKPENRFVTPLYLASAVLALVFRNPAEATKLKGRFMRRQETYQAVFSDSFPLELWPILVGVYKTIEIHLSALATEVKIGERFVAKWRSIASFVVIARRFGTFAYTLEELCSISPLSITSDEVRSVLKVADGIWVSYTSTRIKGAFAKNCCEVAARQFGIKDIERVGKKSLRGALKAVQEPLVISEAFIDSVNQKLPEQPWKPGMKLFVAKQLNVSRLHVDAAIKQLVQTGKRFKQRDGVVFDTEGNIVDYDKGRYPNGISDVRLSEGS